MTNLQSIIPVLESADISRDTAWYEKKLGFETVFSNEHYAVLHREALSIHLQWHAGTVDDPLNGGALIRVVVGDLMALFKELKTLKTVSDTDLRLQTAWQTNEFGCYDLNKNAIIFVEDIQ